MDARVEDYLNDKLQTLADFEALDMLIANLKSQHQQLQQQLTEAERNAQTAADITQSHAGSVRKRANIFEKQKADIDRRLEAVTLSKTSDNAIVQFEEGMRKLQMLDVARAYVLTLQEADDCGALADSSVAQNPAQALGAYHTLYRLKCSLENLQGIAENAAPHLLDQISRRTQDSCETVKSSFAAHMQRTLDKILWPKPGVSMPASVRPDFEDGFSKLLELQIPELEASGVKILYPMDVLVAPLVQRFQFHFGGERPTNRLDKPEYFLSHFLDLLDAHVDFMSDEVQPILVRTFHNLPLSREILYIDATSAYITALLPMLRAKLFSLAQQIRDQPKLLSHLIHELQQLDAVLRTEWKYEPSGTSWKGITHEVLSHTDLFSHWLKIEKDFALGRYEAIIADQAAASLDYDSVSPLVSKPTKHAIRVHDLLAAVTDHYRGLFSFSQRLRFLIEIQVSIFDQFHNRLKSGLEAYISLTSSIGRTVQGASAAEAAELKGKHGLERLCRIFGSSDYLEKAMLDWSEDIFFLDLWMELQNRAARGGKVTEGLTVKDVAQHTSTSLTMQDDDALEMGALFDETASAYGKLRDRTEKIIIDSLVSETKEALRPYGRSAKSWATSTTEVESAPTIDLQPAIHAVSNGFDFLRRALAPLALRRIARAVAGFLDQWLMDNVVLCNTFSSSGATQLKADVGSLGTSLSQVGGLLPHTREAIILLSLQAGPSHLDEATQNGHPNLIHVEQSLFADNDSARDVLDQLGLVSVSEIDARRIIKNRVEVQA